MRILQLIDTLSIGGAERMSVNIANTLAENGIESYLVASRRGGPLQQFILSNVKFYCLDKKNGFDIAGLYRLIKLIKQIKPHIIHAHSTSLYWAFSIKLFIRKCKIIWHDHYGLSDYLNDNDRFLLKFFSKWIDGVIVVNERLEIWCKKNLNISSNRIIYLNNFPYQSHKKTDFKVKKTILLNLANIRPQKDQLNLVDAINIVKQSEIDFELWIAGTCADKNLLNAIQIKIKSLGLENEVKILGPVVNSTELLSKASIGILSSISEGLPLALLEYGLAGLPVICTDTGQCKQVLGNGKYGIVIPPGDPTVLADAIIKLVTHSTEAEQMANAFNKHVSEEYGSKGFLSAYLKFVNNIIV